MTSKLRIVFLAASVLAVTASLAACGGGSGGSSSTSTTTTTGASRPSGDQGSGGGTGKRSSGKTGEGSGQGKGKKGQTGDAGGGGGVSHAPVVPLAVSGGGSAQFHVNGGDNSVQEYGEEAGEAELRNAAETVHAFFVARVRGETTRACSLLGRDERQSLEAVAAQSPQLSGKSCAATLAVLAPPVSSAEAREITKVDAASLRHEGEQAFLIYVGAPEGTVYAMPLQREGEAWRLGAISGSALPGVASN